MNVKNIAMSCVMIFGSLSLSGCYTRLAMFHPNVEDETEEFYSYSAAGPMKSVSMYAQDGAGRSLGMAYSMMYNRFNGGYSYYDSYYLGGHKMYVPTYTTTTTYIPYTSINTDKTPRSFSTDRNSNTSHDTNLNITRTSSTSTSSNTSSKTKSAQSARVTRRN